MLRSLASTLLAAVGLIASLAVPSTGAERSVAVTFDDLPGTVASLVSNEIPALREDTRKLLAGFRDAAVPVVGFVNEAKLCLPGETAADTEARAGVLQMWLDAGHDLGNHTFSHRDLHRQPLAEFEHDVVRGEAVTRRLLAARGRTLRYFRHPFLHVGLDLEKRHASEAFLAGRGYMVAPVTIDNDEYIYAAAYADALRRRDRALSARLATDYLRYMESVFEFIEGVSRNLLGREMAQVLLLHANTLNADTFPQLAAMMKARGYRFVTLEEALKDEAYRRPDTYV